MTSEISTYKILSNLDNYKWHHSKGKIFVYLEDELITFNVNTKKYALQGKYGKTLDSKSLKLLLDLFVYKL
jgi:hypothetical protein